MLYVHGVEEDVLNHRKICESYNLGVPFAGGWKTERLVGSFADGGRIVEVCDVFVWAITMSIVTDPLQD